MIQTSLLVKGSSDFFFIYTHGALCIYIYKMNTLRGFAFRQVLSKGWRSYWHNNITYVYYNIYGGFALVMSYNLHSDDNVFLEGVFVVADERWCVYTFFCGCCGWVDCKRGGITDYLMHINAECSSWPSSHLRCRLSLRITYPPVIIKVYTYYIFKLYTRIYKGVCKYL